MENLLELIPSDTPAEEVNELKELLAWRKRGYLEHSPQIVKQNVFLKYGVAEAAWVETGTHVGTTTNFLAEKYSRVYSIEPGKELFENAQKRFAGRNVELFNGVSEDVLPRLLPELKGDLNFWLDGHFSAGITFRGERDCPVELELDAIDKSLSNFSKVSILIDDIRLFFASVSDYPSIDYLVDWARKRNFTWCIEHDIFIMQNH